MFDIRYATMAHLKSALLRYLLAIDFSSSGQAGFIIFPFVLHWFYRRAWAVGNWFEGFVLKPKNVDVGGVDPRILFTILFNRIK